MPKSFTSSFIVLVHIKDNPATFLDFQLISLCNFLSKVITKVLASRLNCFLRHTISEYQMGFALKMTNSISKKVREET